MDAKKLFGAARSVALASLLVGGAAALGGCKSDAQMHEKNCGGDKKCSGDMKCGADHKCGGDKQCGGDKKCGGDKQCGGDKKCGENSCGSKK